MIAPKIRAKADQLLSAFIAGTVHARKGTGLPYLAIEVGYRYRLLCWTPEERFNRDAWTLYTHEAYNKLTRRGKK